MKFRRTKQFNDDFSNLETDDKLEVKKAFSDVALALQGDTALFYKHRIKLMEGHSYIWEGHVKIDLVFTFHYDNEDGEKICFFRRIGKHNVYKKP